MSVLNRKLSKINHVFDVRDKSPHAFSRQNHNMCAAIKLASELSSRERLVRANRAHARSY